MLYKYLDKGILGLTVVFVSLLIYSCANMASPNGGPYDEDPPRFISSTPVPNQTNFTGKKIEILFDELIQVDNPLENVIITPPQVTLPVIKAIGKKVTVELKDTLKSNTTYTIDFTNSIADNNEKNVLENFSFAFSTGDVIDSLEISGVLLNAENLEPMAGITVGLHTNLADSAFRTEPFIRTSRTNEKGNFTIRNIAPGTYRLYALNDMNRDYKFDQPGEDIAFADSLVIPTFELTSRQDTVWQDSLTIDTIYTTSFNRFLPDNIFLRLFKEKFVRQYMIRPERPVEHQFVLRFNAPVEEFPSPRPLNFSYPDSSWYFLQRTEGGTSGVYWITDSLVWQKDTLQVEVTYLRSDSLNMLSPQTDTLSLAMRRRPNEQRRRGRDKEEEEQIEFLGLNISASGTKNLSDSITITFEEPVLEIYQEDFLLSQKVDTLWNPVDFEFFPDSTNSLNFFITRPWRYGEEYRLEMDSATIYSLYGKWNDSYSGTFKFRERDEYGHLYINIIGVDTNAFVELLNKSDVPVRKAKVTDGGVLFMNLSPDTYYARLIMDLNDNGIWDTGNYEEKLQPEEVFYSPKSFEVMQNWEVEETWDIHAEPITKQKPMEITKNKPKEVTQQKRDYRNDR